MPHKDLQGSLTIGRPRGSGEPSYAQIEINDELSGSRLLSARIDLKDFAEALLGLAHVECRFDLYPELVGKKREHKEELIPLSREDYYTYGEDRQAVAARALAPYEVDGWKGRVEDLFNHHRRGLNGARVTFVRYVEAGDGD